MLTNGTLTPAYGRDYSSAKTAIADLENGKDFVYNSFNGSGYVSLSDFAKGARIQLRYSKLRKVTAYTVK